MAFRKFIGSSFLEQDVPGATTLPHFRHPLESGPNKLFFKVINRMIGTARHMMEGDRTVGAAIIDAPNFTKNAEKKRNPEQAVALWKEIPRRRRRGKRAGPHRWEAAENKHDVIAAPRLIRETAKLVYGDSECLEIQSREVIGELSSDCHRRFALPAL